MSGLENLTADCRDYPVRVVPAGPPRAEFDTESGGTSVTMELRERG